VLRRAFTLLRFVLLRLTLRGLLVLLRPLLTWLAGLSRLTSFPWFTGLLRLA
jgi:hypothetical protein